jgi:formate hydrogenlyase subunit 6/NADH:ubiquinone oxidoreductase subunit I
VSCIDGASKELHVIDPGRCIDCGVCASYCPVDCILDERGERTFQLDQKTRPVAYVIEELCTGCDFCPEICPFDCLALVQPSDPDQALPVAKMVDTKACVGCKLCEEVCIKDAIVVRWPNGEPMTEFFEPEFMVERLKKKQRAAAAPVETGTAKTAVATATLAPAKIAKVWIDPGCIVCHVCEQECPAIFDVTEETCLIKPDAKPGDHSAGIVSAAEKCPVNVIKFEEAK